MRIWTRAGAIVKGTAAPVTGYGRCVTDPRRCRSNAEHGRLIQIAPKPVSTIGQGRPISPAVTSKVEQLGEIAAVFGGDGDDRHENQRSGCDRDNDRCRRCRDCLFGQERTGLLLPATVGRLGGHAICAMGHRVTKQEAVMMGLLTPAEPTSPATQLAAKEHPTVGVAH